MFPDAAWFRGDVRMELVVESSTRDDDPPAVLGQTSQNVLSGGMWGGKKEEPPTSYHSPHYAQLSNVKNPIHSTQSKDASCTQTSLRNIEASLHIFLRYFFKFIHHAASSLNTVIPLNLLSD